jgi:tellurite resistance protein TehA-like permease
MGTPRLADLSPAYFGMVMATGIVSVAAHMHGLAGIAHALFWLNVAAYALIWTLNLLRVMRYPRRFLADLRDHVRGPGFFTVVAATSVLASQFIVLDQNYAAAALLGGIGIVLWFVLTYGIFTALTIKPRKPPLERGLNGATHQYCSGLIPAFRITSPQSAFSRFRCAANA